MLWLCLTWLCLPWLYLAWLYLLWLYLAWLYLPWLYLHAGVREARELPFRLLDVEDVGEGVHVPGEGQGMGQG